MTVPKAAECHLDLLTNSLSFFSEAVDCFRRPDGGTVRLKFAIIHLVQAMELALKETLRRINPALIYTDIDKPKHTVSITVAIQRLQSDTINKTPILLAADEVHYKHAIDLRNNLVHFECIFTEESALARFSGLFTYMLSYYERVLERSGFDVLDQDQFDDILAVKETKQLMLLRAMDYIAKDHVGENVYCPGCGEETFVLSEAKCCLCHFVEPVVDCPNCGEHVLKSDLVDLTKHFVWDYSEGMSELLDRCGIHADEGCACCEDDVKEQIRKHFYSQHEEDEAMERYYAEKHAAKAKGKS